MLLKRQPGREPDLHGRGVVILDQPNTQVAQVFRDVHERVIWSNPIFAPRANLMWESFRSAALPPATKWVLDDESDIDACSAGSPVFPCLPSCPETHAEPSKSGQAGGIRTLIPSLSRHVALPFGKGSRIIRQMTKYTAEVGAWEKLFRESLPP